MLQIMFLRYLFRRALSWTLSPILRTTLFFTEAIYTTILFTCNLVQGFLEDNSEKSNNDAALLTIMASNHNPDFNSSNYNASASICTQTEKQPISSFRNKKAKSTQVIIHNMNPSKKVIVIQNSLSKEKRARGKNCRSGTRSFLFRKGETVLENEPTKQSPEKNQCSSDSSNMSLENDVSDAKIIEVHHLSQSISLPKSTPQCNVPFSPIKYDLNCIKSPRISEKNSKPELSRITELPVIETPEEHDGSQQHKTSSPVEHFVEQEWVKYWNVLSKNQAKTETLSKFSDLYQAVENVQKYNTNTSENTFVSDNKLKRRLSLPTKLNKTSEVTTDFILFRDQIFENVINSSRSKRDSTNLKFPNSLETSLVNRRDEINDSKGGILSSSSYESLPLSDNFRNILEKNSMFLHKISTDDMNSNFSSVDELIEAFQKVKDELTVLKAVQKKMSGNSSSNDNSTEEIKDLIQNPETGELPEYKCSEKSTCKMQNDNLDNQIAPETVSGDMVLKAVQKKMSGNSSSNDNSTEEIRDLIQNSETGGPPEYEKSICKIQNYNLGNQIAPETVSDDMTLTPYFSTDLMKQRKSQFLASLALSNDSAISNLDNSSVHDTIDEMLNKIVTTLH